VRRVCGMAWAAVTVLVGYPYVEKIEKLRSDREKFFSYFALAVGGWSMLIAGLVRKCLEKTGVLEDEGDSSKSLW
jgi:hypothetical protein